MSLLLNGCESVKFKNVPPAELSGENNVVFPAPIPVAPPLVKPTPPSESDFLGYLRFSAPDTTTVVQGRIQNLSVSERLLPNNVWPEEGKTVVTKAKVEINKTLCGTLSKRIIDVSYVGGRLAGRILRTSLMTQDLNPGQEYVLKLTNVDGEYFLVGGRNEYLIPISNESGKYKDFIGREVSESSILGGCK